MNRTPKHPQSYEMYIAGEFLSLANDFQMRSLGTENEIAAQVFRVASVTAEAKYIEVIDALKSR